MKIDCRKVITLTNGCVYTHQNYRENLKRTLSLYYFSE